MWTQPLIKEAVVKFDKAPEIDNNLPDSLSNTGNINLPPVMAFACNCSYICMTEMTAPDRETLDGIFD